MSNHVKTRQGVEGQVKTKLLKNSEFVQRALLVSVFAAACVFYVSTLAPTRFGSYHDDGIYVSTAKALATGDGYRIISLPYEPAQTKYPPFYPFLLSLIWSVFPQFPANVTVMLVLSSIFTVGFIMVTWRYLLSHGYASRWQALIVVTASALNWRMMILATSVYSEMLFSLLAVAGLHLAEKHEKDSYRRMTGVALGVVIGLAFLTRNSGIALLVAVAAYYALKRQLRRALIPITIASFFVICWILWCWLNNTKQQFPNVAYYTSYLGHLNQVVTDLQAQSGSSRLGVFLDIAVQNFVGGVLISVPLVSSGLTYQSFAGLNGYTLGLALCGTFLILLLIVMSFFRTVTERVRLIHMYVVACLGLYLVWLPGVSYDRFLMPLLPFFLLFMVSGCARLASNAYQDLASKVRASRISGILRTGLLLVVTCISLYGYTSGAVSSLKSLQASAARDADDMTVINWIIKNTNPSDTLVCYRDPKYFLYTGRKAVRSFPMTEGVSWEEDDVSMQKLMLEISRIIEDAGASYLVVTSTDFELEDRPEQHRKTFDKMIDLHPQNFVLVFESEDSRSRIYRTVFQGAGNQPSS